jgi:hypothetical protein
MDIKTTTTERAPRPPSRYPLILRGLMLALALLGFAAASIGSGRLAAVYCVVYAAVLIAWGVMAYRSGR